MDGPLFLLLLIGIPTTIIAIGRAGSARKTRIENLELNVERLRAELTRLSDKLERIRTGDRADTPSVAKELRASDATREEETEALPRRAEIVVPAKPAGYTASTIRKTVDRDAPPKMPPARDRMDAVNAARTPEKIVPKSAPPLPRKTLGDTISAKIKSMGPDDPDMGWEMALGTYWLPRIGILAISIAIVFLLTLALQRWGAAFRIATGYVVCAGLLGAGWKIEKRYARYARVLYAGGLGMSYLVTFSTYYVPFARIFPNPAPTLLILAAVVIGWAAIAQRRRSPTVAFWVTALGHLTIALTTFTVENPGPYTVIGIVFLSAGSAFFLLRNRWYYIASIGVLGSYGNHFLLLARSEGSDTPTEFVVGMSVLATYLLIFAAAELLAPEGLRRKSVPFWFRSAIVTLNTACFFGLGSLLVNAYTFTEDYQHVFRYTLAIVAIGFAIAYLHYRTRDPLHGVYMTKGMALVTFGLAAQFDGSSLTAWLAIQTVVLLVSARRSGIAISRALALAIGALTFGHGLFTAVDTAAFSYTTDGYAGQLFQACLVVAAFFAASQLYQRTDWTTRSPETLPLPAHMLRSLWQLDFLAEPPEDARGEGKPLNGLSFPYLYAIAGTILFLAYEPKLVETDDRAVVACVAFLFFAVAAAILNSPPVGFGTLIVTFASAYWSLNEFLAPQHYGYDDPHYAGLLVRAVIIVASYFSLSEFVRRIFAARTSNGELFPSLGFLNFGGNAGVADVSLRSKDENAQALLPFLLAALGALMYVSVGRMLVEPGDRLLAFGGAAFAFVGAAWILRSLPFGATSIAMVVVTLSAGVPEVLRDVNSYVVIPGIATLFATALFCESKFVGNRPSLTLHQTPASPFFLYGVVAAFVGLYFSTRFDVPWNAFDIAAAAIVFAALTNVLHVNALAYNSAALLLWAHLLWYARYGNTDNATIHALPWCLFALSLGGDRYFAIKRVPPLHAPLTLSAWMLGIVYIDRTAPEQWAPFCWTLSSLVFLGYGVAIRSKVAAVLVLLGLAISSGAQTLLAYGMTMDGAPLAAGFLAPVFMWIVCERLATHAVVRTEVKILDSLTGAFVGIATVLLVVWLDRLPSVSEFFLTIAWSMLGVALFALALMFRQKWYRYAGLSVLLLASLRVVFIDTRELDVMPKVAAWAVLGAVLLALGFGYVKAFSQSRSAADPLEEIPRDPS